MATNLALDDNLIEEARRAGSHKTKREAVTAALAEYVKRRKQLRILEAFGSIDFAVDLGCAHLRPARSRERHRLCQQKRRPRRSKQKENLQPRPQPLAHQP